MPAAREHKPSASEQRLLKRQQRELTARAALRPLDPNERPRALLAGVGVASLLALAVLIGSLTIHDLSRHGGSLPAGLFITAVLLALARGMWQRRYWAVLSFQALLAFQVIVTSLALVVAETVLAATICLVSIGLGGWLFWKLVRVMGHIQATEHAGRAAPTETDEALR